MGIDTNAVPVWQRDLGTGVSEIHIFDNRNGRVICADDFEDDVSLLRTIGGLPCFVVFVPKFPCLRSADEHSLYPRKDAAFT